MPRRLQDIGFDCGTNKAEQGYLTKYERHFQPPPDSLLEVGIFGSGSLKMWREFFPDTHIVGMDIDPGSVRNAQLLGFECHLGDATEWTAYEGWLTEFDVIIDDGSHQGPDVVDVFEKLWPFVAEKGWYVIEDLNYVFSPDYQGDDEGGPVMALLHELSLDVIRGKIEMFLYHDIAFIHKAPHALFTLEDDEPVPWEIVNPILRDYLSGALDLSHARLYDPSGKPRGIPL